MDGFTAVRCGSCAHMPSGFDEDGCGTVAALAGVDEVLFEGLRAVVRDSPHGLLVTSGCRLGPGVCATRQPGLMLLVQACDAGRRRPASPVVAVGPVRCTADVRAVTRWLQGGGAPDPTALPARLRCAIAREPARG
ncbi:hypothetical protein H7X46_17465 [Pseudonocardia sp. C8]|uniref:hypothetical protein n=1 Tax=Pseudonocardia sp. C8 TaxID=2762759 RepID=UPI00164335A9|nr:hypothetical protein [Pseudonocardia sp. C8]MBC3192848.1 hypothetical protein [Pseudonocardia sp. C8]